MKSLEKVCPPIGLDEEVIRNIVEPSSIPRALITIISFKDI